MVATKLERFNALIDVAQGTDPSLKAWAHEVVTAAGFLLDYGCGFGMNLVRRCSESENAVEVFDGRGVLRDSAMAQLYGRFVGEQDDSMFEFVWRSRRPVLTISSVTRRVTPSLEQLMQCSGAVDALGMLASAGPGRYFSLFGYLPPGQRVSSEVRAMLACVRPHVEAGLRLRSDPTLVPVAVLTDAGKFLHLDGDTELSAFTPSLKSHIARLEALRVGREEVESVVEDAWEKICVGRWILAERTESDGRRHYVIFETREQKLAWTQVAASDRKMLAYFLNGLNGKQVAAKMKVSEAQVSTRLAVASRSLGLRRRTDLLRLVAVLRPNRERDARFQKLTQAEREVLAQLELGRKNEEIALLRGRSTKTVANQVASILRKTAGSSRRSVIGT